MTHLSARYSALNQSTRQRYGAGRHHSRYRTAVFFGFALIAVSIPVLGATHDPSRYSTQEATRRQDGIGAEKDIRPLEPGQSIKRELTGGQRHIYQIKLRADQFLKVIVEQQGIDVVAQVLGPDGAQILEVDSESRPRGQEQASLVAEAAGDYRLIVKPKQDGSAAGSYEIHIEELRAATED
ncbi:MAG TPA: hypothetical protein VKG02_01830, partial [Blastocatellia bacterium]|nr:hypothetical protein [Blastocatellia bacterium]